MTNIQRSPTSSTWWIQNAFALLVCWIFVSVVGLTGASSSTKTVPSFPQLHGIQADPLVQAAPLVIAIACRDGVAVVAATSTTQSESSTLGSSDVEPLLYFNADDIINLKRNSNTTITNDSNKTISDEVIDENRCTFLDLPDQYAGPYRVQSLGISGTTAFVSCGWKADGYIRLLSAARDIIDMERSTFGEECNAILPEQLSLFLAQCAVSERVRLCCNQLAILLCIIVCAIRSTYFPLFIIVV
jgi:hypothetical protein